MNRFLPLVALLVILPALAARPAAAAGLTLDLTTSTTKAKVGDDMTYSVPLRPARAASRRDGAQNARPRTAPFGG